MTVFRADEEREIEERKRALVGAALVEERSLREVAVADEHAPLARGEVLGISRRSNQSSNARRSTTSRRRQRAQAYRAPLEVREEPSPRRPSGRSCCSDWKMRRAEFSRREDQEVGSLIAQSP